MTDYSGMSKDELLEANVGLMQQRADAESAIRDEQLALTAALDVKIAEERVTAQVSDMPASEREALKKALDEVPLPEPAEESTEDTETMEITSEDVAVVDASEIVGGGE